MLHRPVHAGRWRWSFQEGEEYDELLVASVDGSYFPPTGCKVGTRERSENQSRKRKQIEVPDGGGRIGWGLVVGENKDEESEDQGTCECDGISEETTDICGELTATQKLMPSCQDLERAWLIVRGDFTFAGGASFADCDPGSEQLWPLVSSIHRAFIGMFERKNHTEFAHMKTACGMGLQIYWRRAKHFRHAAGTPEPMTLTYSCATSLT